MNGNCAVNNETELLGKEKLKAPVPSYPFTSSSAPLWVSKLPPVLLLHLPGNLPLRLNSERVFQDHLQNWLRLQLHHERAFILGPQHEVLEETLLNLLQNKFYVHCFIIIVKSGTNVKHNYLARRTCVCVCACIHSELGVVFISSCRYVDTFIYN